MYNLAKKYLLLGLSVTLLIIATLFFFEQKTTTTPIEIATKKPTKLLPINYDGHIILDDADTVTAGTVDLAAMAQSITTEALKAFLDSNEHSLPLLSHWNVGIPELTDAMNPMYMIDRIEQGEHILVSWKLDPYYADTIGSSYYEESIKKAAELQLPLVFIFPSPESALTKDSYYKSLPKEDNPNVIDANNNTLDKLSPFGPDERWSEVGNQWSTTTLMNQLQEWYPNPPLVIFISEDEADKLSWNEVSIASRYWECYSECSPEMKDDNYKRTLVGGKWIEKYRQMQNGFKEGFTKAAWKDNIKFISYNKLSDNFGKSTNWIDNATVTNQYVNLWPLTTDGTTIDFDLSDTKSDVTANAPHVLANNLDFMLKEAKRGNSDFAYQLSINDDSKITDVTRYRGLTQFALWFLRPNFIRQQSSVATRTELEPMFEEVVNSVELIHYNPHIAEFWKNGELVKSGDSYLNENIPEQYQNDPRWFLLDVDVNPEKPWTDSTEIKTWAFAIVKGEVPNREWLIYTQSPEGDMSNSTISIPAYNDVLIDSSVNGNFYILSENDTQVNIIETRTTNETLSIPSAITDFAASDGEIGKVIVTFTNAIGNPIPTYNLFENNIEVATNISTGYSHTVTTGAYTYRVDAVNSEGTTSSNNNDGTSIPSPDNLIIGHRPVTDTDISLATKFASPTGNGNGTIENPYSIVDAFSSLVSGDVLFLRGGTYDIPDIGLRVTNKSGTENNPIIIESYPGETAILDGKNRTPQDVIDGTYNTYYGFYLNFVEYIHIRKIEIIGMREQGIFLKGRHSIIEGCKIHENFLTGIHIVNREFYTTPYIDGWNIVRDNEVYNNSDAGITGDAPHNDGDNADGISVSSGQFNIVHNNTIYGNADDGIDVWRSNDSEIYYNLVYDNGRGANGNGNGIKIGGNLASDATNGLRPYAHHNISHNNKDDGFDQNAGKDVRLENNTAWKNGGVGFNILPQNAVHPVNIVKDNIALDNIGGNDISQNDSTRINNSWNIGGVVEFINTNPNDTDFLKPIEGTIYENIGVYVSTDNP